MSLNKNCKLNIFKLIFFFLTSKLRTFSALRFGNICNVGAESQLNSKGRRDYSGAK